MLKEAIPVGRLCGAPKPGTRGQVRSSSGGWRGVRVCCSVTKFGMINGRSGFGMSSLRGEMVALLFVAFNRINFADFASHAKVGDPTDTCFVDQNILQLDVSVNVADSVMDVLETSHDLPEHHPYIIVGESGVTVALRDVVRGADRAILSDEVIGVGRMLGLNRGRMCLWWSDDQAWASWSKRFASASGFGWPDTSE
jgi:hypothetical protein